VRNFYSSTETTMNLSGTQTMITSGLAANEIVSVFKAWVINTNCCSVTRSESFYKKPRF
jgi:hypothetical protein